MGRLDPKIIRVDDRVVLAKPQAVLRVGYPKTVRMYTQEVEEECPGEIAALVNKALGPAVKTGLYADAVERITKELGYLKAKKEGFGGSYRGIFFRDLDPVLAGKEYRVLEMMTVLTGTRYEGHYYPPSYDEMWGEWESPSLALDKAWRLARLDLPVFERALNWQYRNRVNFEESTWVPVANLTKVHAISTEERK